MDSIKNWLEENNIEEVQCITCDHTGIPRGKILPVQTFINDGGFRIPEAIMLQAACGDYIDDDLLFTLVDERDIDMVLKPDANACFILPWTQKPTAMIIHDCFDQKGELVELSARNVLKKVIELYNKADLQAVVAPEMELYLAKTNPDPNQALEPPIGRSGHTESGRQSFGIDAMTEFSPFIDDLYTWAKQLGLSLDAAIHEEGAAQFEFNFIHGDPLALADQVFVFKRMVKEAASKHGITATFMAKPIHGEPGNAMHIHQSVINATSGENIFATADGDTDAFRHYIGGLQKYIPQMMPMFAPNINSYKRFIAGYASPVNLHWGLENRTVGLRVPNAPIHARRVENRLPGADTNPYLAIAATLLCGYIGMTDKVEPSKPRLGKENDEKSTAMPTNIDEAIATMAGSEKAKHYLGDLFVQGYTETRKADHENYKSVISAWERHFLLTAV